MSPAFSCATSLLTDASTTGFLAECVWGTRECLAAELHTHAGDFCAITTPQHLPSLLCGANTTRKRKDYRRQGQEPLAHVSSHGATSLKATLTGKGHVLQNHDLVALPGREGCSH